MASFQNGLKLWCESLFIHIPLCPVCFVWTLISYVHYIKTVRVLWLLCELGKQRNSRSLWAIDFHSDSSSCLWMQCEGSVCRRSQVMICLYELLQTCHELSLVPLVLSMASKKHLAGQLMKKILTCCFLFFYIRTFNINYFCELSYLYLCYLYITIKMLICLSSTNISILLLISSSAS